MAKFSENPIDGKLECYTDDGEYKGFVVTMGDTLEEYEAIYGDIYSLPKPKVAIQKLLDEGFFDEHPELRSKFLTRDGKPRTRRPK